MLKPKQIMPGLYLFQDTCNVYVLVCEQCSIAIDFGSGQWLKTLSQLNLPPLKHVYLTHHHADQCAGLAGLGRKRSFIVHVP